MSNNNMQLWDSVSKTDPIAVKPITGKSYSGNSPKPYWLIERATKEFGACGIGWGVQVVSQSFQQVSPTDWLHTAVVRVWYMRDGIRGEIEQAGGTKASYQTNAGKQMVDEDAAKKSITDGMVKCLSMIGFAGDIFSGRWDDSKYVQEVGAEFAQQKQQENIDKARQAKQSSLVSLIADISSAKTRTEMEAPYKQAIQIAHPYPDLTEQVKAAAAARGKEITQASAPA